MYSTLQDQFDLSDLDVLKLKRGVNIVKKNVFLMLFIYGLSFYLDVLLYTFIMHLSYFVIRLTSFGAHLQHFISCMLYSTLVFVGLPYLLSKVILPIYLLFGLMCFSFILITIFAPSPTSKHPIAIKHHAKLKRQSMFTAFILCFIAMLIPRPLSQMMIVGICIQSISLLPIFKKER